MLCALRISEPFLVFFQYDVVWNENFHYAPRRDGFYTPLTKEQLELATYHQSYQYGTATKAVRAVPCIYYSDRLANKAMGYVNYLRARRPGVETSRLVILEHRLGGTQSLIREDVSLFTYQSFFDLFQSAVRQQCLLLSMSQPRENIFQSKVHPKSRRTFFMMPSPHMKLRRKRVRCLHIHMAYQLEI